jgi:hypothetical protein
LFFYVDESGHTGKNLFDENQPTLYYGVLSSTLNLDILANRYLLPLRKKLGVERLHAGELGNGNLTKIASDLLKIQKKFKIRFDIYSVVKEDHALISFFDQVFDQGLNPAMSWTGYWTPLRYVLLLKLSYLFDEETLRQAWMARIEIDNNKAEQMLVNICKKLGERINILPDERSRQLIGDSLKWVEQNPSKIHYNIYNKAELLSITPNLVGFQAVMHGITMRILKHKTKASRITVDRQTQFNRSQNSLHDFYKNTKDINVQNGIGLPELDWKNIPLVPIRFTPGTDSSGLELVDVYLWIFKRFLEKKEVAPELLPLIKSQFHRGRTNEISIKALTDRWEKWFEKLPPAPTGDDLLNVRKTLAPDEARRQKIVHKLK